MIVRVVDDGARDGDALLLTARELARVVVHAVLEADHAQRRLRALLALGREQLGEQERQLDVLERGEHRHQVVRLEDEADVSASATWRDRRRSSCARSLPATRAVPDVGESSPAIRLSSVLLPEPEAPSAPRTSPRASRG